MPDFETDGPGNAHRHSLARRRYVADFPDSAAVASAFRVKIFRLRPKVRGKNVLPESSTGEGAPGRGAAAYYLSETDRPGVPAHTYSPLKRLSTPAGSRTVCCIQR